LQEAQAIRSNKPNARPVGPDLASPWVQLRCRARHHSNWHKSKLASIIYRVLERRPRDFLAEKL